MSQMYPPCMMQPNWGPMKQPKQTSFLKEYIAFQKFLTEQSGGKKDDGPKTKKGQWAWVEDPPEVRKYSILETAGIACLLAIPVCAAEIAAGMWLMHLIGIK